MKTINFFVLVFENCKACFQKKEGVKVSAMKDEAIIKEELKQVQIDILKQLDKICRENGLRYYLAYGTCLGAVRHKGYIPWDHDMDVLMPIEDAKQLIDLQSEFPCNYFVQSYETDPEYQSIAYRLRRSDTTCIEKECVGLNINHGIYIDIYPFYNCPKGNIKFHLYILKSYIYRVLVANRIPYNHGNVMKIATRILLLLYKGKRRGKKIRKIEKQFCAVLKGNGILDYYGEDISLTNALVYSNKWFDIPKDILFEGEYFWGPTDPQQYLQKRYGDFMKLPSKEIRNKPIPYLFVDTKKSYIFYKEKWEKRVANK